MSTQAIGDLHGATFVAFATADEHSGFRVADPQVTAS
jgi:hypothetical protein